MDPESQAPGETHPSRPSPNAGPSHSLAAAGLGIEGTPAPTRAAAAIETQDGPDILEFFHNWQTQHADEGAGVTRGKETGGRTCIGYPT